MPAGDGGTKWESGLACRLTKTMVDGSRRQRRGAATFFFLLWGREELTGLGDLAMDGLVMNRMDHLAQRHCWSELPTWRAVVEGCGLACVGRIGTRQKEKRCRPRPCKQQAFGQSGSQTFDCSMGLLGFLDSWGLALLTFDADDADGAWVALCQAEPESLTLRSLVEVVVSVVGS